MSNVPATLPANRPARASASSRRPAAAGGDAAAHGRCGAAAGSSRRCAWRSSTSPTACTWPTGRRAEEGAASSCRRRWSRWRTVKDDLLVLSGLTPDKARANGDGPGDHARAMATFLTGRQATQDRRRRHPRRRLGRPGRRRRRSARPRASPRWRSAARAASNAGNCDSGYSCAYSSNLSWRGRIDADGQGDRTRGWSSSGCSARPGKGDADRDTPRRATSKSILDFVAEDASAPARRSSAPPTSASSTST